MTTPSNMVGNPTYFESYKEESDWIKEQTKKAGKYLTRLDLKKILLSQSEDSSPVTSNKKKRKAEIL